MFRIFRRFKAIVGLALVRRNQVLEVDRLVLSVGLDGQRHSGHQIIHRSARHGRQIVHVGRGLPFFGRLGRRFLIALAGVVFRVQFRNQVTVRVGFPRLLCRLRAGRLSLPFGRSRVFRIVGWPFLRLRAFHAVRNLFRCRLYGFAASPTAKGPRLGGGFGRRGFRCLRFRWHISPSCPQTICVL